MAIPESTTEACSPRKMTKKDDKGAQSDKKLVIAAQVIKYAKYLAGNDKKFRDKALKSLKRWFQQRSFTLPFSEGDFMVIWKGLFYSMWMSDKPLIQEECAENISQLIHSVTPDCSMLYFKCTLTTLSNEWFGIDQLRLDKFLMLVRRVLRQAFYALKHENWKAQLVEEFQQVLEQTVLSPSEKVPLGLVMHFTEIYLEELSKVSEGKLHPTLLLKLLVPFVKQLVCTKEMRQVSCIRKNIFRHLMRQSDVGLDYNEKYQMWRTMGFPGKSIDSLQKEVLSDDEKMSDDEDTQVPETNVLDPRAGHVDVLLPQLKFNPKHVINLLTKNKFLPGSNTKSRRVLSQIVQEFTELSQGRFPLGVKKLKADSDKGPSTNIKQSVNRLVKFEKKLMGTDSVSLKKQKKRKKQHSAVIDDPDTLSNGSPVMKKAKMDAPEIHKRKRLSAIHVDADNAFRYTELSKCSGTWSVEKVKSDKSEAPTTIVKPAVNRLFKFEQKGTDTTFSMKRIKGKKRHSLTVNPHLFSNGLPAEKKVKLNTSQEFEEHIDILERSPTIPNESDDTIGITSSLKSDEGKSRQKKLRRSFNGLLKSEKIITEIDKATPTKWIKGKNRHSTSFEKPRSFGTPVEKKVKIDLRLNKSQEIDEHIDTLRRSPAIPFDANKKPSKPLLKRNSMASPINPFYKQRKLKW